MSNTAQIPTGYRPLYDGEIIHETDLYLNCEDNWKSTVCSGQTYTNFKFEPMCRKIKPAFISSNITGRGDFPYIEDYAAFIGADSINYDDDGDTVSVTLTVNRV